MKSTSNEEPNRRIAKFNGAYKTDSQRSNQKRQGGFMSSQTTPESSNHIEKPISSSSENNDYMEKLIITLGQRMNTLNKTLHKIAESLEDIELHLRDISISSNPAPNYRRPLSEYRDFDWTSIG